MKNRNIWKRILTHKAVVIPVVIIGLLALFGFVVITVVRCGMKTVRDEPPVYTPGPTPTATPMADRDFDGDVPIEFDPDTEQMPLLIPYVADGTVEFTAEFWADVTPEDVRAEVDCLIIRHRDLGVTYLLYENEYFNLDDDRNATGVLDIVLCDILGSGRPQLIYTVSEGYSSDMLCFVGMFDFETRARTFSDFALRESYLALEVIGENSCEVYRALRLSGETWGGYRLVLGEKLGELMDADGRVGMALH